MKDPGMTDISTQTQAPAAPPGRLALPVVKPYVTYVLLAMIIGIFALMYLVEQSQVDPYAADPILTAGVMDYSSIVNNGEWYRLVSAMFIHLSIAHIAFNALALWRFGQMIEGLFGHIRFVIIYFLSYCNTVISY